MDHLVYIVPTRGRPENVRRLALAFNEHTRYPGTQLVFGLDEDDPELEFTKDTVVEVSRIAPIPIVYQVGPRVKMNGTLNMIASAFCEQPSTAAIGFMGDDHLPLTPGWDAIYMEWLTEHGKDVVFGNDTIWGAQLPTQMAMKADIVRALGWVSPPPLLHLYLDNFWRDLGNELGGLQYIPHVTVRHLHPIAQAAEWDPTYVEANSSHNADGEWYAKYAADGGIKLCADKVREWRSERGVS